MGRVGLVTAATLAAKRKYALVITFIVAAVLTPPDIISQVGLALPIIVLYEISILSVRFFERRRATSEEKAEDQEEDDSEDDAEDEDYYDDDDDIDEDVDTDEDEDEDEDGDDRRGEDDDDGDRRR